MKTIAKHTAKSAKDPNMIWEGGISWAKRESFPGNNPIMQKNRIFFGKLADMDGSNVAPNPDSDTL